MNAEFRCRIDSAGRVHWASVNQVMEYFRSIAGKRATIVVEPGKRTPGQNRKIHAIFNEFSERTGYSPAEAKDYLKSLYMAEPGEGTHSMNVEEAADFIEFAEFWMANNLPEVRK